MEDLINDDLDLSSSDESDNESDNESHNGSDNETEKESYGTKSSFKYFIGYNDDDVIRSLCIKLPQMVGYVKHFHSNKTMSFKVGDNKLLKKYNKIWKKLVI